MIVKSWVSGSIWAIIFAAGLGAQTAAVGQTLSPVLSAKPEAAAKAKTGANTGTETKTVPAVELAPHRAVYNLSLEKADSTSNVTEVRGRLVLSFKGSKCAGYSLDTRIVTEITDRDGKNTLTDMRSSTWEQAAGGKFRFSNSQYLNQRLSEQVIGRAARGQASNSINIQLNKPEKRKISFNGAPLFPTQHTIAVLKAAQSGQNVLQANIYDGSEKGVKMYETTSFIGKPRTKGADTFKKIKNGEALNALVSWPVLLSYYESSKPARASEGLPDYELSFILYANGVSRKLLIDYGSFTIAGDLTRIDFFKPAKCASKNKGRTRKKHTKHGKRRK
ncbi:MAG: cell envelope integrity EipB family protein [Alphaproteobacteria bacterium]